MGSTAGLYLQPAQRRRSPPPLVRRALLALTVLLGGIGEAEAKRITIFANQSALLVHIAKERGYFREQGLDVEIQLSQSGPNSINAVIEGRADFNTSAETPFVISSFDRPDLRILATISASDTTRLIARADRGIKTPRDLAGKRIGITLGSVSEYFLARYLTLNGIQADTVTMIDMMPERITEALVKGEIDAALTWEPYVRNAELALKDNVATLPDQYDQIYNIVLVSTQSWLDKYPLETRGILRAIIRAETYAAEHPSDAKILVRRLFDLSAGDIDYIWPLHNLHVSLPQGLLFVLEQQAEWRVRKKLTNAAAMPNYLDFVATDPLRDIRESSVGIVK